MFGIASKRPAVAGAPMVAEALPILVRVDERTGRRLAWSTAIFSLATGISRILFPIVVLLGVSGIVVGILNSYEEFAIPALTPVFWNLAIIAGLVIGVPRANTVDTKLYVYAGSIVIGTVIQVLLPFPWLR